MRVLLLEDDAVSARTIEFAIRADNVIIEHTESGEEAIELAKIYDFDIALVDMRLPDMDGCTVIRRMRHAQLKLPVMIVSGVEDQQEKVRALIAGADDYINKPFDPPELHARLHAIVRRSKGLADSTIQIGRMTINTHARSVEIDGQPLHVTAKEYSILELLALRQGMTLSKETFLDHLYGGMDEPEQKIIDVFICKLRKKIALVAPDAHNIQTVWGHGYVMKEAPLDRVGVAEEGAVFETPHRMDRDLEAILEAELTGNRGPESLSEVDKLILSLLP